LLAAIDDDEELFTLLLEELLFTEDVTDDATLLELGLDELATDELATDELTTDDDELVAWQAALVPHSHTTSSIAISKPTVGSGSMLAILNKADID
jgi:hypothetical protein